jgi:hypothetical protein
MAKAGPIDPPRVVCHHRGGLDRAPESCNPFIAVPMPFACERSSPGLFAQSFVLSIRLAASYWRGAGGGRSVEKYLCVHSVSPFFCLLRVQFAEKGRRAGVDPFNRIEIQARFLSLYLIYFYQLFGSSLFYLRC